MRKIVRIVALLAIISLGLVGCGDKESGEPAPDPGGNGTSKLNISSIESLNKGAATINSHADIISRSSLKTNYRSLVNLGDKSLGVAKPHYPRIKKMANGGYIMFFHNNQIGASCYYAISQDLVSWLPKGKVFTNYAITDSAGKLNEHRVSNADAVVLANGDILAVASYRANVGYKELPLDAGLVMKRSTDNGISWSETVKIYQGVNWEPYMLQLPSGEIHCYLTDSSRTEVEPVDTGTVMIVSNDNGKTWTPSFGNTAYYVLRTAKQKDGKTIYTNQMPSVIKLNGSNELAAALEANIDNNYYISFAYSGEDGEWTHLAANEEGPEDRNDSAFAGAAPYIRQFTSGETVVSYNRASALNMRMGDSKGRNFGEPYIPFLAGGFWGAIEVIDNHRIAGVIPNTSKGELVLAEIILNHNIKATSRKVTVDGTNSEWAVTDDALFVGEKSQAQATLRCSVDTDSLYFLIEVLDNYISKSDYAAIYLSSATDDAKLTNEACRIRVSLEGLKSSDVYNNSWVSMDFGVTASAKYDGTMFDNSDKDIGYLAEIAIPRSKLDIKSGAVLANFAIFDNQGGEVIEDAINSSSTNNTAKWVQITGL